MSSSSLGQLFKSASGWFASNHDHFENSEKLLLYGLYKQATDGNIPLNAFLLLVSMDPKQRAWGANKGMVTEEAEHRYVEYIESRNLGWSKATAASGQYGTMDGGMGLCPSTMRQVVQEPTTSFEIYYEAVRKGDQKKILEVINSDPELAGTRDDTGGSAMHWAADANRYELITLLLDAGFRINDKDGDNQTPLHLAAICEHVYTVKELLEYGANPYIKDDDDVSSMDIILESSILKDLPRFVGHALNDKVNLSC